MLSLENKINENEKNNKQSINELQKTYKEEIEELKEENNKSKNNFKILIEEYEIKKEKEMKAYNVKYENNNNLKNINNIYNSPHQKDYQLQQGNNQLQQGNYQLQQGRYPIQQGGYPIQQGGYNQPISESAHEHPLKYNQKSNVKCKICSVLFIGQPGYKCESCDVSICLSCSNRVFYGKKREIHPHPLALKSRRSWKCDLCKKLYKDVASFYCKRCDFDICDKCYLQY